MMPVSGAEISVRVTVDCSLIGTHFHSCGALHRRNALAGA
jgi:hypothetical protein